MPSCLSVIGSVPYVGSAILVMLYVQRLA
jgi:hypothetical protein